LKASLSTNCAGQGLGAAGAGEAAGNALLLQAPDFVVNGSEFGADFFIELVELRKQLVLFVRCHCCIPHA
jgi:hypothetical protein